MKFNFFWGECMNCNKRSMWCECLGITTIWKLMILVVLQNIVGFLLFRSAHVGVSNTWSKSNLSPARTSDQFDLDVDSDLHWSALSWTRLIRKHRWIRIGLLLSAHNANMTELFCTHSVHYIYSIESMYNIVEHMFEHQRQSTNNHSHYFLHTSSDIRW